MPCSCTSLSWPSKGWTSLRKRYLCPRVASRNVHIKPSAGVDSSTSLRATEVRRAAPDRTPASAFPPWAVGRQPLPRHRRFPRAATQTDVVSVQSLMGRRGGRGKWRGWAHRATAGSGSTAHCEKGRGGGDSLDGKREEQSLAPRAARAL